MRAIIVFRHPHLTQGVVHTAEGSFAVQRGLVRTWDSVGDRYGWERVECDSDREGPGTQPLPTPVKP